MLRKVFSFGGALLLTGALALAAPAAGWAQHGGHSSGGHSSGGHYSGGGGHYYGGGGHYYGGGHYGGGHYYGGHYYGAPFWGFGLGYPFFGGYGLGYPYYGGYGYYSSAYPYSNSYYYDPSPVVPYDGGTLGTVAPPADAYPMINPSAADPYAHVTVRVPADAQVWVQNALMNSNGPVREFESPALQPGTQYTYTITARWQENGHDVTRTRKIDVSAGSHAELSFFGGTAALNQ